MCGGPQWKREIVPDHKFDFVDVREFEDKGFGMRMKYLWLYVLVLKSFLVYVSDIFTAVTMLTTKSWSNQIFNDCPDLEGCVAIPFNVGKWLFVGCIIFSFLLLAYESRKAKKIIASHDISYAFTNIMANNYYSLRSYPHFCFFDHISSSTKRSDDFAFFIFFTFKSWKRLLLADAPRQTINALTLYAIYLSKKADVRPWWYIQKYFEGNSVVTTCLEISTLFTVIICAGSLLTLLVAGVLYIPLLIHIKGNLKEYCCHKVDKRITEIIRRRNKQRLARAASLARKEAAGDYSHLKNKKGQLMQQPLPQPTLPNIDIDDDDKISIRSGRSKGPGSTLVGHTDFYPSDAKSVVASDYNVGAVPDYSNMPAYAQPYSTLQDPHNPYAHYNPSAPDLGEGYDQYGGSTAYLASGQQGYGQQDAYGAGQGYVADPYDVYAGGDAHGQHQQQYAQHGYDQQQPGYDQHYGYDQQQQQQHYQQQHQAGYGGEHLNAAPAAPLYRSPSPSNYGTEPSYHTHGDVQHGAAPAYGSGYAV
ncbi:unnamed protein product [Peniophora sp. CBMAI 1063]|nr:unnamed protein product [Peniophora sp. CBMAI 1063]